MHILPSLVQWEERLKNDVWGLDLESRRLWYRKNLYLYKIEINKSPNCLFKIIPSSNTIFDTRNTNDIPLVYIKYNFFKDIIYPSTIIEWNKLDPEIWNSASFNSFKESILKSIRPAPNSIFRYHNSTGIKYLKWLRVKFSHLRALNFKHSFQDTINLLCTCSKVVETKNLFILHFPYYENERHILLASIRSIKSSILDQNVNNIVKTFLYGLDSLSETQKTSIFNGTMEFLISFNRFVEQLY